MTLFKKQSLLIIGLIFCLLLSIGVCFDFNNIAYAETEITAPIKSDFIYAKYTKYIYQTDDVATNVPNTGLEIYAVYTDEEPSFYLPYTYYLQIIQHNEKKHYYIVSFCDKEFYINDSLEQTNEDNTKFKYEIKSYELTPEFTPFPNIDDTTLTLLDGQTIEYEGVIYDNNYTYNFIGSTETSFYVKATSKLDTQVISYFNCPKDKFNDFKLKANPLHVINEDPPVIVPPVIPPKSNALRIIIIVGIAVPAVLIMLFIFMPKKKEVIVENDFMNSTKKDDIDYDRDRSIDDNDLQNDKERKFNRR